MFRFLLIAIGLLAALPAAAQDVPAQNQSNPSDFNEIRAGVLAHDVSLLGHGKEHGVDANAELLLASPVSDTALNDVGRSWRWLLQPRPHLGASVNTAGATSQIYFGITDTAVLARSAVLPGDLIFFSLGFGPAFNNGHISTSQDYRKSLGSNVLFHPILDLGWQVTPTLSVSLVYDHSSNAGLASRNEGLNNLGVRVGMRF
jgi:lipid A 3-O-deacylase